MDEHGEESSSSSKFSWRDHWCPVSLIEDLDPSLPTPFQLLGRDLVLWFDRSAREWVAFDDKCPHRLAPLSVTFYFILFIFSVLLNFYAPIEVGISLFAKKSEEKKIVEQENYVLKLTLYSVVDKGMNKINK